MRRRALAALGVALLLGGSAAIAQKAYPTGRLTVAGAPVAPPVVVVG